MYLQKQDQQINALSLVRIKRTTVEYVPATWLLRDVHESFPSTWTKRARIAEIAGFAFTVMHSVTYNTVPPLVTGGKSWWVVIFYAHVTFLWTSLSRQRNRLIWVYKGKFTDEGRTELELR